MMISRFLTAVFSALLAITPTAPLANTLTNAGFESSTAHEAWTLHVYGTEPTVELDTQVAHSGQQSLRVAADQPSDVAFGQELQLTPGRWYRLTDWVRTENLDPHGAPTYGTFQVQQPGGTGIIATGRNHPGTCDWVREDVYFTPPGDGLTRIAIFFVGYGKGTGTAWFDDLSLEEISPENIRLRITPEPLCKGEISPFLKARDIASPVRVTIWGEEATYAEASFEPGEDWQRFTATVIPTRTDHHATGTVSFRGPSTIQVDQISLMPEDNVFGWRSDVANALTSARTIMGATICLRWKPMCSGCRNR